MWTLADIPVVDIVGVEVLPGHKLAVSFEDGKNGIFDMEPYLSMPAFEPLKDEALFARARVANGTVTWPGGIDMAPDKLWTDCVTSQREHARA